MNKDVIIYLCGIHSLGFAIFHMFFWKLFKWKTDLQRISIINRGILQIANLRLIHLLFFTAFLCFYFTQDLYTTRLGRAFLIGISLFWIGRTIEQFIFIRIQNPLVHLLTALFVLGGIVWILPVF